jgi:hypothetical protein
MIFLDRSLTYSLTHDLFMGEHKLAKASTIYLWSKYETFLCYSWLQ